MSKAFSLVRQGYIHELGFAPWVKPGFGRTDGYVDSRIFGGSSLGMVTCRQVLTQP